MIAAYLIALVVSGVWMFTCYHFNLSRAWFWRGVAAIVCGWLALVVVA